MSGLDPDRCAILEIATIVTDAELEVIAEGPDLVIHHDDAVLDAMDEWCTTHHGQSGLTAAVKASTISLATRSQASCLRLETVTLAPCAASACAMARPMPRVAPVTMAVLPLRSNRSRMRGVLHGN